MFADAIAVKPSMYFDFGEKKMYAGTDSQLVGRSRGS